MLDSFRSCHAIAFLSSCSFEFLLASLSSAVTSALLKSANTSFSFMWSTSWVEDIASGRWVNYCWSTGALRLSVCHAHPLPTPRRLTRLARVWSTRVRKCIVGLWAISSRVERKWFSHTDFEELLQLRVSGSCHCVFWDPQTKPAFFWPSGLFSLPFFLVFPLFLDVCFSI